MRRREPPAEIPPHDPVIERAVLGLAVYYGEPGVLARSCPEHFWIDKNRVIRAPLDALVAAGKPIDPLTLSCALREAGELDQVGGAAYLTMLFEEATVPAHAPTYVRDLIDLWVKRELLAFAKQLGIESLNGAAASDIVRSATSRLEHLGRSGP